MNTMEDMVARELAMAIMPHLGDDYKKRFDEEIELENGISVFVNGVVYYSTSYEEDTNYSYTVDVSVDIDGINVYDADGDKIEMKLNQRAIERYMAQYIEE